LGGLFLFLMMTVMTAVGLERIWPVFMSIVGLSLFAYGMVKRGYARLSMTIPGIAIIALSLVFLPFSLGLAHQSFRAFVGEWWPVLFVVLGLVLILIYALRRRRVRRRLH
ncbi:LiaI-LiaF-like domain-containing protein, partial [Salinispira pacifica]